MEYYRQLQIMSLLKYKVEIELIITLGNLVVQVKGSKYEYSCVCIWYQEHNGSDSIEENIFTIKMKSVLFLTLLIVPILLSMIT